MTRPSPAGQRRLYLLPLAACALAATGLALRSAGWWSSSNTDAWSRESTSAFEQRLVSASLDDWLVPERATLLNALSAEPKTSARAALLLARDKDPAVTEALLVFLEERQPIPQRNQDAGACTSAAALGARALTPEQVDRLANLALTSPHPDLEVRTECAIAAFRQGRRDCGSFLIRVLRIDTESESVEGPLTDSPTTAWARGRAAECLANTLGQAVENWTDAPLVERQQRADELSRLLGEPDPCLAR